jgi:hypothetical protein
MLSWDGKYMQTFSRTGKRRGKWCVKVTFIYSHRGVGTATGYGLGGRGSIPGMGKRIFHTPRRPDRLRDHTASYPIGTGGQAAEA